MSTTDNTCILYGQCTSPTNIPEFIDTSVCLCGLLQSRVYVRNGEIEELWRCIGNASADIEKGGNGKWYNTLLSSQERSGIDQPQNWAGNGPDTSQVYVLSDMQGAPVYETLNDSRSPYLTGNDAECTGKNESRLSTLYYGNRGKKGTISASISSTFGLSTEFSYSSSSILSSSASTAATSMSTTSTATPTTTIPDGSSTSSTSAAKSTHSSGAIGRTLKAMVLVGILVVPFIDGLK